MSEILTAKVLDTGYLSANTLTILMTRETVHDKIGKFHGAFKRVIIDIDGEQHEYDADMVISALERYGRIAELEELIRHNAIEIRGLETMVIIKNMHISELESLVRELDECRREESCGDCGHYDAEDCLCPMRFGERMAELGIEAMK